MAPSKRCVEHPNRVFNIDQHQAELILPEELYEIIENNISSAFVKPGYSRVILPLKALVEGEFFNEYIKKGNLTYLHIHHSFAFLQKGVLIRLQGNILMLSEGRAAVDNVYSLKEGL
jgi:ribonucleases P/MRP protein subunit RPP40